MLRPPEVHRAGIFRFALPLLFLPFVLADCVCQGNGHLEPVAEISSTLGDNVVRCNCNLTFNHESCDGTCRVHFGVDVCVPPALRVVPDGGMPDGGADGGVTLPSERLYARKLDTYCRASVTNIVYNLIQVWNGAWCDYKEPFAPNGGVGESVRCFATPIDNKTGVVSTKAKGCEKQCRQVACNYDTNCRDVQDTLGNIDLAKCRCSQVVNNQCKNEPPGGVPTSVFCRPELSL